jgi:hypothetical protein
LEAKLACLTVGMEEKPSQTIPLGLVWQDVEIISKRKTSVSTTKKEEKNLF